MDTQSYLERGKPLEDWWTDIPPLIRGGKEKRGWETQKPERLLERLVRMFSREDHWVMDPFMGSGTTGLAAIRLNRRFLGVDISPKAVEIAEKAIGEAISACRPFWIP